MMFMRSRAAHYKHVVVEFDDRCRYSRGEAIAHINGIIDERIANHAVYARVSTWFGISMVTAVYVKVYPNRTSFSSSMSFDKSDGKVHRIAYIALTVVTSTIHLWRTVKIWNRGGIKVVAKDFFHNISDRMDSKQLPREIKRWVAEKRGIAADRGKAIPSL